MHRMFCTVVVAALSVGCTTTAGQVQPIDSVDHAVVLADHETPTMAGLLVPVAGAQYVDPPPREVTDTLILLHRFEKAIGAPGLFTGLSMHGVVSDDPAENRARTASGTTELGFLELIEMRVTQPEGTDENEFFFRSIFGIEDGEATRMSIAGVTVFRFEQPDRTDSRYAFCWLLGRVDLTDASGRGSKQRRAPVPTGCPPSSTVVHREIHRVLPLPAHRQVPLGFSDAAGDGAGRGRTEPGGGTDLGTWREPLSNLRPRTVRHAA